jgi:hypothetical protein
MGVGNPAAGQAAGTQLHSRISQNNASGNGSNVTANVQGAAAAATPSTGMLAQTVRLFVHVLLMPVVGAWQPHMQHASFC